MDCKYVELFFWVRVLFIKRETYLILQRLYVRGFYDIAIQSLSFLFWYTKNIGIKKIVKDCTSL